MARQLDELIETPAPVQPPETGNEPPYLNRELSLLDFQERVLSLAEDTGLPLLERAKFLAIFSSNIDEFFQVRVAGLKDQVAAGVGTPGTDGSTPAETLAAIRERLGVLATRQSRVFLDSVVPALAEAGIRIRDWDSLDHGDQKHMQAVFDDVFPVLTPLAVDPGHPFPYISNLSLNLAVIARDPVTSERRFARVKVPPLLPRFVGLPDGANFVPLEQVIAAHLDRLFAGMEIECHYPFRVTRNTDLTIQEDSEEADDLLAAVEMELRQRRFGQAVRLEIDTSMSDEARDLLERELEVEPGDVYVLDGPLGLSALWALHDLARPDLKDEPWQPVTPSGLLVDADEHVDVFAALRERDILVHHPYDSFRTTVEAFVRQAARDPKVLAIKQTLYRTSGDSPIVKALIRAAERGKQVSALVELKARFDEQANIAWARALEEAGVHVVYGLVGFKTHSKTALVVRQEDDGIRRYCHVGTGNYNPKTARMYEDVGLLSANPDLGADLTELFNFLTGYSRQHQYRKLLLAPTQLRARIVELIDGEAAGERPGRIVMKMNSLVDKAVIDALYSASIAGTSIDLIVRSMCSLRPGVPGLSDNIRVRSVVGRYLEHSRIFAFGEPEQGGVRYLIGSADMMQRNLDKRIEVVVPVEQPALQVRLQEILDVELADDTLAWQLDGDGRWSKVPTVEGVASHSRLQELALERQRKDAQSLVSELP
ncbi:MAG TPA: RNA degradosome polyphosphate kinase [Acidimicrobiales bacterium]|nr:RNA degradosome polyphosphate kinase [Acidimicrobiales bacterium]